MTFYSFFWKSLTDGAVKIIFKKEICVDSHKESTDDKQNTEVVNYFLFLILFS